MWTETEESKDVASEEIIILSGKNSAEVMDCFGSLLGIADEQDGTDTTFV